MQKEQFGGEDLRRGTLFFPCSRCRAVRSALAWSPGDGMGPRCPPRPRTSMAAQPNTGERARRTHGSVAARRPPSRPNSTPLGRDESLSNSIARLCLRCTSSRRGHAAVGLTRTVFLHSLQPSTAPRYLQIEACRLSRAEGCRTEFIPSKRRGWANHDRQTDDDVRPLRNGKLAERTMCRPITSHRPCGRDGLGNEASPPGKVTVSRSRSGTGQITAVPDKSARG